MTQPIASLSLDLDNKWAYLRAAGRRDWEQTQGFQPTAIPVITQLLGELELPLTVFLVGRDLADESSCRAIEQFSALPAWEPANHSLNHLPWMHTMAAEQIAAEVEVTHERIEQVTSRRPVGFRGPGFSCPPEILRVLLRNGYRYDASVFPTSLAPVARAFFLWKTDLKGAEREKAKKLYGGFASLRQPNRPFERAVDDGSLWEVPVTVMPWTRTPIHFSYFLFLASHSATVAKAYFRTAIRLCQATRTPPSLLLHPTDFLGREDDADMAYFPGMKLNRQRKLSLVRWALQYYAARFDVRCMLDQVQTLSAKNASMDVSRPLKAC